MKRTVPALLALVALAFSAPAASAGLLVSAADGECDRMSLTRPFLPWLDVARYGLAPDGGFERGARGWTLRGGAVDVAGNEPWRVRNGADGRSLRLRGGASATSPVVCVGLEHPTIRFFARRTGASLLSTSALRVDVLFEDASGAVRSLPIGADLGLSGWHPTLPMPILVNLLPLLPGETTPVAFRFTALGNATWRLDDVYVDPWAKR